ncbi:alpha-(1,3)-fucosyltransferase C-like [Pectinophora gossypiella]|uniref:alpha-(1,3)-fucosyltransferase C-like n=1 Tax=Pectinophora gossypiella TaxID=13191 RepID=UPI00214F4149|nr:alpha-(1,3)-fucosyltransferase C-like [Pectinophora gossypiella]XP_049878428.1 alpha-(1,3)-fucosyltransferase C-like [Pectinophora gossypiella]
MPRCFIRGTSLKQLLRPTPSLKLFILLSIFTCTYVFWTQQPTENDLLYDKNLTDEALQNIAQDSRYAFVYRKKTHLPKDLKYILLWTPADYAPFYYLGKGQRGFVTNNCSMVNCYVTDDRHFFGGDLSRFDALAFNGRNIQSLTLKDLPKERSPHQKYIYFNTESADNYPVCNQIFDGFFNWTATYRLDSDIIYPYILIRNKTGDVVGPKLNMEWVGNMEEIDEELASKLRNKSKAAAWFVSHCSSSSRREEFVHKLRRALLAYGLKLDIYGDCGILKCPRSQQSECNALLEKKYHFYMSLENSFNKDYVTEKLLTSLQHNLVPIVYAGANLSRFLPPGSFIDGRASKPEAVAGLMYRLMKSEKLYQQYFRWKNYYTYHDATFENVCTVCQALNDKQKVETFSQYKNFREWWNPLYTEHCKSWIQRVFKADLINKGAF